jgi:hypothetical protein
MAEQSLADATDRATNAKSAYISALQQEVQALEAAVASARSDYISALQSEVQALDSNLASAKSAYISNLQEELNILNQNLNTAKSDYINALNRELNILKSNLDKAKSDYVSALQKEASIIDNALNDAKSKYLSMLQSELSELQGTESALESAIDSLKQFREALLFDFLGGGEAKVFAEDLLESVLGRARSGDIDAYTELPEALGRFVDASADASSTYLEYARDVYKANRLAKEMETTAGGRLSETQQQIEYLKGIIDSVDGVNDTVTTIEEARAAYEAAMLAAQNNSAKEQLKTLEEIALTSSEAKAAYEAALAAYENNDLEDQLAQFNDAFLTVSEARAAYESAQLTLDENGYQAELDELQGIKMTLDESKAAYEAAVEAITNSTAQQELTELVGKTLTLDEARAAYEEAKTALEESWHVEELNSLLGIESGIYELKDAYLEAMAAQEAAQNANTAAMERLIDAQNTAAEQFSKTQSLINSEEQKQAVLGNLDLYAQVKEDQIRRDILGGDTEMLASFGGTIPTAEEIRAILLEHGFSNPMQHYQQFGQYENLDFGAVDYDLLQRKQAALNDLDLYAEAKRVQILRDLDAGNTALSDFANTTTEAIKQILINAGFSDPMSHYQQFGQYENLEFADGGIASGPTSGYPVTLHGTEVITPVSHFGDITQELRELRSEVVQLRKENQAHAVAQIKSTQQIERNTDYLEEWDVTGIPEERVA